LTWGEFTHQEPELAALGEARFERTGLVLVATLRRNGWARISPVKPFIVGGQLYLGMMWQSKKALDLLRDPRCTIHNTVSDRQATEGEFKVYGRAVNVTDLAERRRFGDAVFDKIGFRPEEPEFHCLPSTLKTSFQPSCGTNGFTIGFGRLAASFGVRGGPTRL
jgi:hypothetical protein